MHRKTTAALLVTMAVSALSGCVSVAEPSVRESASPTTEPVAAPSAHRGSATRPVEAPAREALRMMGPPSGKDPVKASARAPEPGRSEAPGPRAAAPEHRPPAREGAEPPRRLPVGGELPARVLPRPTAVGAELCSLGRRYGGWPADSPQARICESTYPR
ncbi:hypothetical protein [Streptomyces triticagri]|nr:hypothetical protein [Streptomyces triticagri]